MRDVACAVVLVGAALAAIVSALGVLRSRTPFAALHASGVANVLVPPAALVAVVIQTGFGLSTVGMLVLAVTLVLGAPIACHALAAAEHRRAPR